MDLGTPEARGKSGDVRFMERVLTGREHQEIRRSVHPDRLLWAFWAARETAYKVLSKMHPHVSSVPGRYEVVLEGEAGLYSGSHPRKGIVHTPNGPVPVLVMFTPEYVHCIGGNWEPGNPKGIELGLEWGVGAIDASPESGGSKSLSERESHAARFLAASKIAEILHCHPQDIFISKQCHQSKSGPPKLYIKGKPAGLDISLSHDGRFAAFAVAG